MTEERDRITLEGQRALVLALDRMAQEMEEDLELLLNTSAMLEILQSTGIDVEEFEAGHREHIESLRTCGKIVIARMKGIIAAASGDTQTMVAAVEQMKTEIEQRRLDELAELAEVADQLAEFAEVERRHQCRPGEELRSSDAERVLRAELGFEQLEQRLRTEFPGLGVRVELPIRVDGRYWLDLSIDGFARDESDAAEKTHVVTVVWSPDKGFGVYWSAPGNSIVGYGEGADETFESVDTAFARVAELLRAQKFEADQRERYESLLREGSRVDPDP
jgi:hypothetical protein